MVMPVVVYIGTVTLEAIWEYEVFTVYLVMF